MSAQPRLAPSQGPDHLLQLPRSTMCSWSAAGPQPQRTSSGGPSPPKERSADRQGRQYERRRGEELRTESARLSLHHPGGATRVRSIQACSSLWGGDQTDRGKWASASWGARAAVAFASIKTQFLQRDRPTDAARRAPTVAWQATSAAVTGLGTSTGLLGHAASWQGPLSLSLLLPVPPPLHTPAAQAAPLQPPRLALLGWRCLQTRLPCAPPSWRPC